MSFSPAMTYDAGEGANLVRFEPIAAREAEETNLGVDSNNHVRVDTVHDVRVSSLADGLDETVLDSDIGLQADSGGRQRQRSHAAYREPNKPCRFQSSRRSKRW